MKAYLPFLVVGITAGSIYAMAALGLVLTYKTSGIFNFGHGAMAAAGAYVFYDIWVERGVDWRLTMLLVVLVIAPIFGLVMELLARVLAEVSTAAKIVATVGLLVGIQGTLDLWKGPEGRSFPSYLSRHSYRVSDVLVERGQIYTVAIALLSAVALFAFFRFTRLGTAMRAVVDNPELLDMTGVSPARVRRVAWIIGSSYAALSGILIAPSIGLVSLVLSFLVVQAFGAAAVGALRNLPLVYVGGIAVGIGEQLSKKIVLDADVQWLSGIPASFPFLVLFVLLLVIPRRLLAETGGEAGRRVTRPVVTLSRPTRLALAGAGITLLLVVPTFAGTRIDVYTSGLIFALLFVSLGLLVRESGQVSLCHLAFAAVGAATYARLTTETGTPALVALLAGGLLAVPIGAVVAIPAIRLSRLYLAIATFGFAILMDRLVYGTSLMFGQVGNRRADRPGFTTGDNAYYYLVLAVVLAGVSIALLVIKSRLGRLLRALADSPTTLSTHGANANVTRVIVFCVSAFLAGIAGALLAGASQSTSSRQFPPFTSLLLLPVLYLAGSGVVLAPFLAAFWYAVFPAYITGNWFPELQPVIFGFGAIAAALATSPRFAGSERLRAVLAEAPARSRHNLLRFRRAHLARGTTR